MKKIIIYLEYLLVLFIVFTCVFIFLNRYKFINNNITNIINNNTQYYLFYSLTDDLTLFKYIDDDTTPISFTKDNIEFEILNINDYIKTKLSNNEEYTIKTYLYYIYVVKYKFDSERYLYLKFTNKKLTNAYLLRY
jgi:hypothetical protein